MANSQPLNIDDGPSLPNFAYYDKSNPKYNTLKTNLNTVCSNKNWNTVDGIYKSTTVEGVVVNPVSLDMPYYMAKNGNLNMDNLKTVLNDKDKVANQIAYLTCQLEKERNREYSSSDKNFKQKGTTSIQDIFNTASPGIKPFLVIIFIITMYLLISGFFGSIDVACNIFSIVEKNSTLGISYWSGLLIGLALPVILLTTIYKNLICKNLDLLQSYEITDNEYGIKNDIPNNQIKIDYTILILFILIIYAFTATLFTIKQSNFGNLIYSVIIGTILFILAIFIYLLYAYVPFFNTTEKDKMLSVSARPLRLFIDNQEKLSDIKSNQGQDESIHKAFERTVFIMFILAILFFIFGRNSDEKKSTFMSIISGFLSSSAVLILPIIWVFNFIIAINFFYIYPIILIVFRFFRYICMGILYLISEKSELIKDMFSSDLVDQLENFKDYSPSWGLIGVDILKSLLNIFGYENIFSKSLMADNNNSKNISSNKFISGAFLNFFFTGNKKGIILMGATFLLSIIVTIIIIFGVVKVKFG